MLTNHCWVPMIASILAFYSYCTVAHSAPAADPPKAGETITNSIGMKLTLIPAGEFMMGSPETEVDREADEKLHHVRITKAFYMGTYEVTQAEYESVMGTNPSGFRRGGVMEYKVVGLDTSIFSVDCVSWNGAQEFCKRLSTMEGKTCRLPTEAEWEYACRAGTKTPFSFGSELNGTQANCYMTFPCRPYGTETKGPELKRTTAVGSYQPNAFGLYDMHGNVDEWCQDFYDKDYYSVSPVDDPQGPSTGNFRVKRSGSWGYDPRFERSASRGHFDPRGGGAVGLFGFRVVRE